jgi:glutathione synthase/RimK-type ligase-like ATP-grasp enzyme
MLGRSLLTATCRYLIPALSTHSIVRYDLAIAWTWEHDEPFAKSLEVQVQQRKLTTYNIGEHNVDETIQLIQKRKIDFALYLDRAWDVDDRFESLGRAILKRGGALVNPYEETTHCIDKASMHLEFISAGLHVPFSIIISPYADVEDLELTLEDLAHLGRPFIIKPANTTGGGIGVVTGAESLLDVLNARKEFEEDKYLIQEKIHPRIIEGRRCWFRCFFVYGKVFLCWWDDLTHVYTEVTSAEEHFYKLKALRRIMRTIARISKMNFFSSEIALRTATSFEDSHFVVVDYVNDMCDMRTADIASDGIPNPLFERIVERLALAALKAAKA